MTLQDMPDAKPPTDSPVVWKLLGDKAGDNAQVEALAAALGWDGVRKKLSYRWARRIPNLLLGASLASLDRRRSDDLGPPWPDLVIAVGRRSVPVARWIRRQSGGHARLVQIGRPRAPAALFDLVVTTPQYCLTPAPNVVERALPMTPAVPRLLPPADPLSALPRPRIVALVGGPSGLFRLDQATAQDLHDRLQALAARWNGSLLITTSRRTPAEASRVLLGPYAVPAQTFGFGAQPGPSPYPRLLAAGDVFVVTADSASMIADAAATGRPVLVFEATVPAAAQPLAWRLHRRYGTRSDGSFDPIGRLYRWLLDLGFLYGPRRLDLVLARVYREGMAAPLPDQPPAAPPAVPRRDDQVADLSGIVARIRGMFREA